MFPFQSADLFSSIPSTSVLPSPDANLHEHICTFIWLYESSIGIFFVNSTDF